MAHCIGWGWRRMGVAKLIRNSGYKKSALECDTRFLNLSENIILGLEVEKILTVGCCGLMEQRIATMRENSPFNFKDRQISILKIPPLSILRKLYSKLQCRPAISLDSKTSSDIQTENVDSYLW